MNLLKRLSTVEHNSVLLKYEEKPEETSASEGGDSSASQPKTKQDAPQSDNRIYYKFGEYDIDLNHYIHNLGTNMERYVASKINWTQEQKNAFKERFNRYKEALIDQLNTESQRFSTGTDGISNDENGEFADDQEVLYIDKKGNTYTDLESVPSNLRESIVKFDANKEIGQYANLIGGAIVTSGRTKEYYDALQQAKIAQAQQAQAQAEATAASIAKFDPAQHGIAGSLNDAGLEEFYNSTYEDRVKALSDVFKKMSEQANGLDLDFSESSYKTREAYITALQAASQALADGHQPDLDNEILAKAGMDESLISKWLAERNPNSPEAVKEAEEIAKTREQLNELISNAKIRKVSSNAKIVPITLDSSISYGDTSTFTTLDTLLQRTLGVRPSGSSEQQKNQRKKYYAQLVNKIKTGLNNNSDVSSLLQQVLACDSKIKNLNSDEGLFIASGDNWILDEDNYDGSMIVYNPVDKTVHLEQIDPNQENVLINKLLERKIASHKAGGVINKYLSGGDIADNAEYEKALLVKNSGLSTEAYDHKKAKLAGTTDANLSPKGSGNSGDYSGWKYEDYARIAAMAANIGSMFADPVSGALVNLGADAIDLSADISDTSMTAWDVAKNAAINLGLDVVSLIPGGETFKIGRQLKGVANLVASGLAAFGVMEGVKDAPEIMTSLKNVAKGDYSRHDLEQAIRGTMLLANSANFLKGKANQKYKNKKIAEVSGTEADSIAITVKDRSGKTRDVAITGANAAKIRQNKDNKVEIDKILKGIPGMENYEADTYLSSKIFNAPWRNTDGSWVGWKNWYRPYSRRHVPAVREINDAHILNWDSKWNKRGVDETVGTPETPRETTPEAATPTADIDREMAIQSPLQVNPETVTSTAPPLKTESEVISDFIEQAVKDKRTLITTEQQKIKENAEKIKQLEEDIKSIESGEVIYQGRKTTKKEAITKYDSDIALQKNKLEEIKRERAQLAKKISNFEVGGHKITDSRTSLRLDAAELKRIQKEHPELYKHIMDYQSVIAEQKQTTDAITLMEQARTRLLLDIQTKQLEKEQLQQTVNASQEKIDTAPSTGLGELEQFSRNPTIRTLKIGDQNIERESIPNVEELLQQIYTKLGKDRLYKKGGSIQKFYKGGQKQYNPSMGNAGNVTWENYKNGVDWLRDYIQQDGQFTQNAKDVYGRINASNLQEYNNLQNISYRKVFDKNAENPGSGRGSTLRQTEDTSAHQRLFNQLAGRQGNAAGLNERFNDMQLGRLPGAYTKDSQNGGWVDGLPGTMTWLRHLGDQESHVSLINQSGMLNKDVEAFWNPETQMVNFRLKPGAVSPDNTGPDGAPVKADNPNTPNKPEEGADPSQFGGQDAIEPFIAKKSILDKIKEGLPEIGDLARVIWLNNRTNLLRDNAIAAQRPFIQDPVEDFRAVHGDLEAIARGQAQMGQLRNLTARATTSDAAQQMAARMEGEIKGNTSYVNPAYQQDSSMQLQTGEANWKQNHENILNRHQVGMANRQSMHNTRFNIEQIRNSALSEVTQNWNTYWMKKLKDWQAKEVAKQEELDAANLADLGRALQANPKAFGLSLSSDEERVLGAMTLGGYTYSTLPTDQDRATWKVVKNKLEGLQASILRKQKGYPDSPYQKIIDEGNSRIYPIITDTPTQAVAFADGGSITKAKIKERIANSDRFQKMIIKQIESLDKKLDRISKSLYGTQKIVNQK